MKKIVPTSPGNMLADIYSKLIEFPNEFRSKVGQECLWSVPTFYRKMKSETGTSSVSNAEKDKIISVLDEGLAELTAYFQKYRKGQ